jgi:pimeloyl-ACP methyl ester carboxylesterase
MTSDAWQYQMVPLSNRFRCIAYDRRGHGRSSDPGTGFDYNTLAVDLRAVLEVFDVRDARSLVTRWPPANSFVM